MTNQAITKKEIRIGEFLVKQKQEAARGITIWRKRNKKYFKGWDSLKAIHILRKNNDRP